MMFNKSIVDKSVVWLLYSSSDGNNKLDMYFLLQNLKQQQLEFRHDEFYALVHGYHRARHRLCSAEHDFSVLRRDASNYSDMVWEIREETIAVQVLYRGSLS
jgi:hypothetical protein